MTNFRWWFVVLGIMIGGKVASADCDLHQEKIDYKAIQANANAGVANAQYVLGRMYEYGICSEADDSIAVLWYEKAAEQDNSDAAYRLGVLYDNGWGVQADDSKAANYYRAAAVQNHRLAQHDLAIMYLRGTGVERDYIEAYRWLFIAVQAGNEIMRDQLQRVALLMNDHEIAFAQAIAKSSLK